MSQKSANSGVIGRRYASAFFAASVSESDVQTFLDTAKALLGDPSFNTLIKALGNANKQKEWFEDFAKTLKLTDKVKNFLMLIASKNRMLALDSITKAVEARFNMNKGQDFVTLVLYAPASDQELEALKQAIKKIFFGVKAVQIVERFSL